MQPEPSLEASALAFSRFCNKHGQLIVIIGVADCSLRELRSDTGRTSRRIFALSWGARLRCWRGELRCCAREPMPEYLRLVLKPARRQPVVRYFRLVLTPARRQPMPELLKLVLKPARTQPNAFNYLDTPKNMQSTKRSCSVTKRRRKTATTTDKTEHQTGVRCMQGTDCSIQHLICYIWIKLKAASRTY